jgi:26S proteasome regulatory subunit T4
MQAHETMSEALKNRTPCPNQFLRCLSHIYSVRFSIKDLQKDYRRTEDDIKAVQSVGQIIGEVMKQLDDERCACLPVSTPLYAR